MSKRGSQRSKTHRCVILANGDVPDPDQTREQALDADLLLAADGGARHALALELTPHVIIGDLDSLDEEHQLRLRRAGARFIEHPPDKDQTDLELALEYAVEQDADPIVVLAALGGRLDQALANVILLTLPILADRDVRLIEGAQTAFVIRDQRVIFGAEGDTVSLIPLAGPAKGVTTEGLVYPLAEGTLPFGPALGVSNEMTSSCAHVKVANGLLLCVHRSQTVKERAKKTEV